MNRFCPWFCMCYHKCAIPKCCRKISILKSLTFSCCGGRTRSAFSPVTKIVVATSVCTDSRNCPPDSSSAMGSRPAPYKKRKEKSHPDWDDFFFSGCGGRTRTYDLRVMSPTSYQLLYSAIWVRSLECLSILAR